MANAVTHTSGQPCAISFRAGGPHAREPAGASVNDQVRTNAESTATEAGGRAVLDSRRIAHPAYADAVARANRFRGITSRRHL